MAEAELIVVDEAAGGFPDAWRAEVPASVQLVLDCTVVGRGEEADMAMRHALAGDRVRAFGTVHQILDDADRVQWEVRAQNVLLLRPFVHVVHWAPVNATAPSAPARPPKAKYRALPPRQAAIASLRQLTDEQRRDKAADAAAKKINNVPLDIIRIAGD